MEVKFKRKIYKAWMEWRPSFYFETIERADEYLTNLGKTASVGFGIDEIDLYE